MKQLLILKKILNPTVILTILFAALLLVEAYWLYYKVYGNLSTNVEDAAVEVNIVRLDINNYNKMINLLDSLKVYKPVFTEVENPFK
ncbi:MAG: hypothetical protein KW802_04610 [Candidatus Doudnabacteria bacterium]|nr:hypothetical protein [Candidatus Doudnabacteria bacterium]